MMANIPYKEMECRADENSTTHGNNPPPEERPKYPDYCRTITVKDANGQIKELVFPKALDLDRPKRARTTFSSEQLYSLEAEFRRKQYLVGKERTRLAETLGLSETQVKVWFQNRRTKYKRDRERDTERSSENSLRLLTSSLLPPPPPPPPHSLPHPMFCCYGTPFR